MRELEPELQHLDGAILHVGCGTSDLSARLSQVPGCTEVVNVDYSAEAIAAAAEQHAARAGDSESVIFVCADCTSLDVAWTDRFARIVDKGTLDAVQLAGPEDCQQFLDEMRRVLKAPGGKLLSLTDDLPEQRLELLRTCLPQAAHSFREVSSSDESWTYYLYVSTFL